MRNLLDHCPKKKADGFTLIELLCVILIIGFFFSASIPILSKTAGNFHLRNKAIQIKAMCQLLKRTAVSENRSYKLILNFPQNSYSILNNTKVSPDTFQTVNNSLLRSKVLPDGMSFSSSTNFADNQEIIFSQKGSITSSEFFISYKNEYKVKLSTTLSGEIILEYI